MDQKSSAALTPTATRFLAYAYFGGTFFYGLYSWITFTGPYRWLAELELSQFGAYDVKITFLVLIFVLYILATILAMVMAWLVTRLFGRPLMRLADLRPQPRKTLDLRVQSRLYIGLGVVGLVIGSASGLIGYYKYERAMTFVPFDISNGGTPPSPYVELTAIAIPGMQIHSEETFLGTTTINSYIPLVPKGWKKGEPITYFLRPHGNYYAGPNGGSDLSENGKPFHIKQTGLLFRDDLPGLVTLGFEKNGIKLGSPPIVLDTNERADVTPYFGFAFGGVVLAMMTPAILLGLRLRNRRIRRGVLG